MLDRRVTARFAISCPHPLDPKNTATCYLFAKMETSSDKANK